MSIKEDIPVPAATNVNNLSLSRTGTCRARLRLPLRFCQYSHSVALLQSPPSGARYKAQQHHTSSQLRFATPS